MFFSKLRGNANGNDTNGGKRNTQVGWLVQAPEAAFIWSPPHSVRRAEPPNRHAKSVVRCPAVIDHESRLFEIPCPFDLHVRFGLNDKGEPSLYDASGEQGVMNPSTLSQVVALVPHDQWRHPSRPILQVLTPYRFLSDESVYLTQLPPILHYRDPPLPGLVIGGRLPIHVWPRKMNWGFEWYDTTRDLILTRGEPWFYVRFETSDPAQPVRIVEAELTPELSEYVAGLDGVVKYVNRTFSLFPVAQQRRPEKLLVPRRPR
jgi:hypothetical protein